MGRSNRDVTPDMMHPGMVRKSPVERALDNLSVIADSIVTAGITKDKQNKEWDQRRRVLEINKLDREAAKIGKTYFPSDFGDPVKNPDDFIAYKSKIMNDANMYRFGQDYQPEYNILSPEAQKDVFTYGTGETSGPIDRTPNRIAMNDLINFDAWLLGGLGAGKEVAARHNWKGLLDDFDADLGGYVLDESDYADIEEKGLISGGAIANNGLYILDEEQRDKVINNYELWREGFLNANSETLVSMSDISKIVQEENYRDLQKTTAVRTNYGAEWSYIQHFNDFMSNGDYGVAIYGQDKLNPKHYNFGINREGDEIKVKPEDFASHEKWNNIYNFIHSGLNTEQSVNYYLANTDLQEEMLEKAPKIHQLIQTKINAYNTIQAQYDQIGLDQTRTAYLNHSNIMADGRDVVLDDLRRIGNGILFDKQKNSNLPPQQQGELLDRLIELEQLYLNPDSDHYNETVKTFLQMSYGLGQSRPGQSLLNLLAEVER